MPNCNPCHPDYQPSLDMGYTTCTESVALGKLARVGRAKRRRLAFNLNNSQDDNGVSDCSPDSQGNKDDAGEN